MDMTAVDPCGPFWANLNPVGPFHTKMIFFAPKGQVGSGSRGKIKAVCGDLGHCSLLFKSDPNAVYLPPNAVYWLQGSFQRSSLLPLLSFAASPPFKPEKNNTSFLLSPSVDLGIGLV